MFSRLSFNDILQARLKPPGEETVLVCANRFRNSEAVKMSKSSFVLKRPQSTKQIRTQNTLRPESIFLLGKNSRNAISYPALSLPLCVRLSVQTLVRHDLRADLIIGHCGKKSEHFRLLKFSTNRNKQSTSVVQKLMQIKTNMKSNSKTRN